MMRARFGAIALGVTAAAWLACGTDYPPSPTGPLPDGGSIDASVEVDAGISVIQHHNHATRDGLYVDPAITKVTAKAMHLDATFAAPVSGPVYAQPLFVEHGPQDKAAVIIATQQNLVYALDATSGAPLWKTPALGTPVPLGALTSDPGCGNIDPTGITGTPYIDLASRTIFLDAFTTPDSGKTKLHQIFALSLEDGGVRNGFPIDVAAAFSTATNPFEAKAQSQRGALLAVDGVVYIPYGGLAGDCGNYRGWVVAVPIADPKGITGFATAALHGGIWSPPGLVSDGVSVFATTGNTNAGADWGHGEAVLRLSKGAIFSGNAVDYYVPTNWKALDNADTDLGGYSAIAVDVPGSTPSQLMVALGKDGNAYLIDRTNLGGIGKELAKTHVSTEDMKGAAAAYRTANGSFIAFRGKGAACSNGAGGNLGVFKIEASSPPKITPGWCVAQGTLSSPMVTSSDGTADAIVWAASPTALYGYDGDTGDVIFDGSAASGDAISGAHKFNTPMVAKGRIYVAGSDHIWAFTP